MAAHRVNMNRFCHIFLVFAAILQISREKSLEGSGLYTAEDKIVLLNNTNFQPTVCGSQRAWMVEFYSSWCGHCIHFAPVFKELAADVYEWRDVISVAAIDCAQEDNMPTCREYEIMGYPSLKFFAPSTPAGDMGVMRESRDKSVEGMKKDMLDFVQKLQEEEEGGKANAMWPNLVPYKPDGVDLSKLWSSSPPPLYTILFFDEDDSQTSREVMLDMFSANAKLQAPIQMRRIVTSDEASKPLLQKLNIAETPVAVAVNKDFSEVEVLKGESSRQGWQAAVKSFIWSKSKQLSVSLDKVTHDDGKDVVVKAGVKQVKVAGKKEVINRRYKVFMSDLEKTILYAVSHEVAQHNAIAGETLQALQQFVTVLDKYFPSRPEMSGFLLDLHRWVHSHEDALKGEDLSHWVSNYHGISPIKDWVGCKGTESRYGGYPCGLWSLFHTLTVNQANLASGDSKEVLQAMFKYIKYFFGCRECARHFSSAMEEGRAIERDVKTHDDAVLLLWKAHNTANRRLKGDLSEDPVYPKQVFPGKEFCTGCYNKMTGSNLWDEFNHGPVLLFLKNQYSKEKLIRVGGSESHALIAIPDHNEDAMDREFLDKANFTKKENTGFIFFNGADISICFMLWIVSAVLLILIYMKFVSKKRLKIFGSFKRKDSSLMNPLLGKV